jgi:hypothetical protein
LSPARRLGDVERKVKAIQQELDSIDKTVIFAQAIICQAVAANSGCYQRRGSVLSMFLAMIRQP